MKILSGLNIKELTEFVKGIGEPEFRARQLHSWIYVKCANNFDLMSDLSKKFRQNLNDNALISDVKIKTRQISDDGTIKYLLEYQDGATVETVLMRFDNRSNLTACVSSQVGCPLNCAFCATAKRGFIRNLSPYEIIEQVLTIQRDTGLKVTNVVFMGQGEPLLNWDNVYKAMELFNTDLQIGIRRITVSSAGIAPVIKRLANYDLIPTLAISLHAPNQQIREKIMPIAKKYNLECLFEALKVYNEQAKKRVTVEYVLIGGVNDSLNDARELSKLISPLKANVNLIPYNPAPNCGFKKPFKKDISLFRTLLESSGKKVTLRLERGADIDAACGQLSGKVVQENRK